MKSLLEEASLPHEDARAAQERAGCKRWGRCGGGSGAGPSDLATQKEERLFVPSDEVWGVADGSRRGEL